MKSKTLLGITLIVLGAIALAYQGITYTTRHKAVDIGPVQVTTEREKTILIPPIVGGLAVIGGIVLLLASKRNT